MVDLRAVLEQARHELVTLHGLVATDKPSGGEQTWWSIDTVVTVDAIDAALEALDLCGCANWALVPVHGTKRPETP